MKDYRILRDQVIQSVLRMTIQLEPHSSNFSEVLSGLHLELGGLANMNEVSALARVIERIGPEIHSKDGELFKFLARQGLQGEQNTTDQIRDQILSNTDMIPDLVGIVIRMGFENAALERLNEIKTFIFDKLVVEFQEMRMRDNLFPIITFENAFNRWGNVIDPLVRAISLVLNRVSLLYPV